MSDNQVWGMGTTQETLETSNLTIEKLKKTVEAFQPVMFYRLDDAIPLCGEKDGNATVLFFKDIDCCFINPSHLAAFAEAAKGIGVRLVELSDEEYAKRMNTLYDKGLKELMGMKLYWT